MEALVKALSVQDIMKSMESQIKSWFVHKTMSRAEIADAIIRKAEEQALMLRDQARKMRAQMLNIKDSGDNRVSRLEQFENDEKKFVTLGGDLYKDREKLLETLAADDTKVKALDLQMAQVSKALETLRANVEYVTLDGSYETAEKAYELAKKNATEADNTSKSMRESLPALIQALEVYDTTKKLAEDQAHQKVETFSAGNFMKDIQGDIEASMHDVRAAEDVERDLAPEEPNDPVRDMLAAREAEAANAEIMNEFAKAAKKSKK